MTFFENKYKKWYYDIIAKASVRVLDGSVYVESHHIFPKCLGGNNKKENKVDLLPKEHFVCHLLLTKMTEGVSKSKMVYALKRMMSMNPNQKLRYIPHGKIYEMVQKEYCVVNRQRAIDSNPMKRPDVIVKHKKSIEKRGKTLGMTGKLHSKNTKKLMSMNHKSGVDRIEVKKKISDSIKKIQSDINYINPMFRPEARIKYYKTINNPEFKEKRRLAILLGWKKRKERLCS